VIVRAAQRFRTSQPGIESWHVLSSGSHYDASRLRAGPLIGVDEHVLAPGAGFAEHAHRGVDIVSWVVSGALAHCGPAGAPSLVVEPGQVLVQRTGTGIRHAEANASTSEPLRLVQLTLLPEAASADREPSTDLATVPVDVGEATLSSSPAGASWVYVLTGSWRTVSYGELAPGDFALVTEPPGGAGELLCWCVRSNS
jgi:hypothetical protein